MKIVLLGYMATGKSTIGKKLSEKLDIPFIDLDEYIVKKEQLSLSDIFRIKGEIYFRKMETKYLKELLKIKQSLVLAVGGGTPCYGNNMEIINNYAKSIYLKASLQDLYYKLSKLKNKKQRPLIANIKNEDLKDFIAKHLFERTPYYERADAVIIVDNKTRTDIVEEINLNMQ